MGLSSVSNESIFEWSWKEMKGLISSIKIQQKKLSKYLLKHAEIIPNYSDCSGVEVLDAFD